MLANLQYVDVLSQVYRKTLLSWWAKTALYAGASILACIAVAIQGVLIAANDGWFSELESICSRNSNTCLVKGFSPPMETSRSSVQLQEIAALSLLVWVLVMIFATIKWPTQAKFAFTSLTLSSRPIFYINQIVHTADLSDKFSISTGYLILKLRLEIVESVILILFVGGFAVYTLVSFNESKTGSVWLYPLPSSLAVFAIEISLRRSSPFFYISIAFAALATVLAVVLSIMQWYYRQPLSATSRQGPADTITLTAPEPPIHARSPSYTPRTSLQTIEDLEIREVHQTTISYIDDAVSSTLAQPRSQTPVSESLNARNENSGLYPNTLNNVDSSDTNLASLTLRRSPSNANLSLSEPITPSTIPPSFHSQAHVANSAVTGADGLSRDDTISSYSSYTTLPSYRTRRSSHDLPPSAFPVRALPVPPPPRAAVQYDGSDPNEG
ncbi:hypothetical protein VNI00_005988 [Paramarasmius palmivorus]|uniref:Uncharacterized protein n=1 Tax=Paramarasmius palmivorus TaxID=297713 RepID=A0AAW0DE99_9AGAR